MNANGIAILTRPHPCGHIVYPYTDENLVAQAVSLYASAGLREGEAVILIMTKSHRQPITDRLDAEGFDVVRLQNAGKLTCIVAEDLLKAFMVDAVPDEALFKTIIGEVIMRARRSVRNGHEGLVRIFGEMVSLLWETNLAAATRLEEMWNEVVDYYSVSLMCTYALQATPYHAVPQPILDLHSHDLAAIGK